MAAIIRGSLPAQTAGGASTTTNLGTIPYVGGANNYLRRVTIIAPNGMTQATAHASNNVTIQVRKTTPGGSAVEVATLTTNVAGGSIVANTPKAITVSIADPSTLKPGDLLDVVLTQNASGVALAAGCVVEVEVD